jgi:hypothetical protein
VLLIGKFYFFLTITLLKYGNINIMADISKCYNSENCLKKDTCYRHTAPEGMRQSYANFFKEGEECEYYWEVQKKKEVKKKIKNN